MCLWAPIFCVVVIHLSYKSSLFKTSQAWMVQQKAKTKPNTRRKVLKNFSAEYMIFLLLHDFEFEIEYQLRVFKCTTASLRILAPTALIDYPLFHPQKRNSIKKDPPPQKKNKTLRQLRLTMYREWDTVNFRKVLSCSATCPLVNESDTWNSLKSIILFCCILIFLVSQYFSVYRRYWMYSQTQDERYIATS